MSEVRRFNPEATPDRQELQRQARLRELTESYGNAERKISCEFSGNAGEIAVMPEKRSEKPMLVRTDTGALVSREREMITERLSACAAVFIQGQEFNYLAHMTPSSRLGYYYPDFPKGGEYMRNNVKRILAAIPEGMSKEQSTATIVVSMANESGGRYDYQKMYGVWNDLKGTLQAEGIGRVKIAELPLDEVTLYYSAEKEDQLVAIGSPVSLKPNGSYDFHPGQIEKYELSLDPAVQENFGIHRPMIAREAA